MTCNRFHWSTVLFALLATAAPIALYFLGLFAGLNFAVGIAVALVLFVLAAVTVLASREKHCGHRSESQTILQSASQCCCEPACICRYARELLFYAIALLFVSFVAAFSVLDTGAFTVAVIAVFFFFAFATVITLARLIYCMISDKCNA